MATLSPMAGAIAEYIGVHAVHDFVVAVWTDTRDGTQDVYSTRFDIPFTRPRLYLPADGSLEAGFTPTFRWSTCWHEDMDSYRLDVSTDAGFGTVDYSYAGLTDNNFTPGGPYVAGNYFWRVKAFRTAGDSTAYSDTFVFTLGCAAGAAPALVSPADGVTLDTTDVTLDWDPVGGTIEYELQVSESADFSSLVLDSQLVTTSCALTGLSDSTTYYWRVNSTNACGTGDWTERSFRIEVCPVLITGDVNVDGVITSADIIYLVSYIFKGGFAPLPLAESGDVNCDGNITSADVIYLVGFVFKSGPPPCDVCTIL